MPTAEIELKFDLNDSGLRKISEHPAFAAQARTSQLRSVYFDTVNRDLQKTGLALRVRRRDKAIEQTLKAESVNAPLERKEWSAAVEAEKPDLKALAETPAARILDGKAASLAPVFTTTVKRSSWLWKCGKSVVELSVDQGEISCGPRSEPICELELELKQGDPESLFDLASALNERACLPVGFQSKAERGFRLAAELGSRPEHAARLHIGPEMATADAFQHIARSCLAQVAANARLLGRHRSPEALHQLRVGLRRLRAALVLFRPIAGDGDYDKVKVETKWLAGELDAARDIDVFTHESFAPLEPQAPERAAVARLGVDLLQAQTAAYDRALQAIAAPRFADLMLRTTRWLEIGSWAQADEPVWERRREGRVDQFAADRLDSMRRKICKRARRLSHLDAQSRHRLRIKTKKLRYAAEFLTETFGQSGRQRRFMKPLEALQSALGDLHDISVAPELALEQIRDRSAEAGFAAGLVVANRRTMACISEEAALKAFARFKAAKPFWR